MAFTVIFCAGGAAGPQMAEKSSLHRAGQAAGKQRFCLRISIAYSQNGRQCGSGPPRLQNGTGKAACSRLCRTGSRQIPIEILTGICYYFPWNHGTLEPSRFCAVFNPPGSQQSGNRARFGQALRGGPQFVMPGREESKGSVVYGTEKDGPCQKAGG